MPRDTSIKAIASRISLARKAAGYESAVEAAKATRIHVQSVRDQEAGRRGADIDALNTYARVYKVSFEWLALGVGAMHANENTLQFWEKRLDPDSLQEVVEFAKFKSRTG